MLGWHWLAHAGGLDHGVAQDAEALGALLVELAITLGLTPIAQPTVARAQDGLAGIVLLAESHAAIHVDEDRGEALLDVFSCRPLDGRLAAEVARRHLNTADVQWRVAPRSPGSAREVG